MTQNAKPVKIGLLGAGARGELNLSTLAKRHPDKFQIVAVAEPHDGRRTHFIKKFNISKESAFTDWQDLVSKPQLADAIINALPCHLHFKSTIASLKAGYHVFLEKPMAHTPGECIKLVDVAEACQRILIIALQCRYNKIYSRVKKLLDEETHGLCVFRSDNDVVDHQTVSLEYENNVIISYSLNAFSLAWERTLNLHGTKGEIRSKDFSGRLELRTFNPARVKKERIRYHGIFHGGGDEVILVNFADAIIQGKKNNEILTSAQNCLESHLICFAAEEARKSNRVVDMKQFRQQAQHEAEALNVQ